MLDRDADGWWVTTRGGSAIKGPFPSRRAAVLWTRDQQVKRICTGVQKWFAALTQKRP